MKQLLSTDSDYSRSGATVVPLSNYVLYRTLSANTDETITVPTGAKVAVLTSIGAASYAHRDGAAAVPSGDLTDGTGSIPLCDSNPRMFRCEDVTTIHVISAGAPVVMAEFFA